MTDVLRQLVLPKLDGIRKSGAGYSARCPAHEDRNASLSVTAGRDQPVLLHCHTGVCTPQQIADAAGIDWNAISKPRGKGAGGDTWMPCGHIKVAEYEYRDRNGQVAFAVARCDRKGHGCQGFRQWRPDPDSRTGKKWSLTLANGTKVGEGIVYQLPRITHAPPGDLIYVVEGEKDCDRLWRDAEIIGTCNAGGAGKWTPQHAAWLKGFHVIVVADRDEPGRKHARQVVDSLMPHAASISVGQAATGKDLSDHLDAGLALDALTVVGHPKPLRLGGEG